MWTDLPTDVRARQDGFVAPDLDGFEKHLRRFGSSSRTIDAYVAQVRLAHGPQGTSDPLARLINDKLAPKSRHLIKSALVSYAKYAKDDELAADLRSLRLPPSRRMAVKTPLSDKAWAALHREVEERHETEPVVAVIGVMERRGLRVGDVLRLRRVELDQALSDGVLVHEAKGRKRLEFGVLRTYRRYLASLVEAFPDHAPGTRVHEILSGGQPESARRAVERCLADLADEAGIGHVPPHQLRRTYAVWFYNRCGRDLEALRQHMQWSSITTAQAYVDHDRRAELDKLALALDDA